MTKAITAAFAVALIGVTAACSNFPGGRDRDASTGSPSAGSSSGSCAGLTGTERERCLRQQSNRTGVGSGGSTGSTGSSGSGGVGR